MSEKELEKTTTRLRPETLMAVKRYALTRRIAEYQVIEEALQKSIPERYFRDLYADEGKQ